MVLSSGKVVSEQKVVLDNQRMAETPPRIGTDSGDVQRVRNQTNQVHSEAQQTSGRRYDV